MNAETLDTIEAVLGDVQAEIERGEAKHGPFNSDHEAYAILLEEVDEFWEEVKRRERDSGAMFDELIQIAAVAVRAAIMQLRKVEQR